MKDTVKIVMSEWAEAAHDAQENWTVDPHVHIDRLIVAGDALRDALSGNLRDKREAAMAYSDDHGV